MINKLVRKLVTTDLENSSCAKINVYINRRPEILRCTNYFKPPDNITNRVYTPPGIKAFDVNKYFDLPTHTLTLPEPNFHLHSIINEHVN